MLKVCHTLVIGLILLLSGCTGFHCSRCCHELDVELLNILPRTDAVKVRRFEWRYRWHTLYLWLQEKDAGWTVIDSAQYSNDVQF